MRQKTTKQATIGDMNQAVDSATGMPSPGFLITPTSTYDVRTLEDGFPFGDGHNESSSAQLYVEGAPWDGEEPTIVESGLPVPGSGGESEGFSIEYWLDGGSSGASQSESPFETALLSSEWLSIYSNDGISSGSVPYFPHRP